MLFGTDGNSNPNAATERLSTNASLSGLNSRDHVRTSPEQLRSFTIELDQSWRSGRRRRCGSRDGGRQLDAYAPQLLISPVSKQQGMAPHHGSSGCVCHFIVLLATKTPDAFYLVLILPHEGMERLPNSSQLIAASPVLQHVRPWSSLSFLDISPSYGVPQLLTQASLLVSKPPLSS